MTYAVKECFLTLQGEGVQAGRRAVFLRFAGCNLWSGREADRASAACNFCDTDFVGTDGPGGGKFADAEELAAQVEAMWGEGTSDRLAVITGGEPMLQLDSALIDALHDRGFRVAVESNGTLAAVPGITGTCSPRGRTSASCCPCRRHGSTPACAPTVPNRRSSCGTRPVRRHRSSCGTTPPGSQPGWGRVDDNLVIGVSPGRRWPRPRPTGRARPGLRRSAR